MKNKADIYLRTSTKEQFPEKQKKECLTFAKSRGYEIGNIYLEQVSGYKEVKRPKYEEVKSRAYKGEIKAVVVWALDRWVRNRDTLLDDVTTLRSYGVKLHSVKEEWLEAVNIEGDLGKTIQEFLLGLVGSLGAMESQRKSERTKMAYENKTGRWGRKSLPNVTKKKIIELFENETPIRQITKQVYYYDKNNHPKYVSLGAVHKIITEYKEGKNTQTDIS